MHIFSLTHFTYLAICSIIVIAYYFIFKNKSKKIQNIALLTPLILAFIVHFLKPLIPVYRENLPESLMAITLESICAISTVAFPFIYISKNKALKDYMVVLGTISGFLTLLVPAQALNIGIVNIEVIRFFFAHLVIFMIPLLMYLFNIHKPTKHWIKHTLIFLVISLIILTINTFLFTYIINGKEAFIELINGLIRF